MKLVTITDGQNDLKFQVHYTDETGQKGIKEIGCFPTAGELDYTKGWTLGIREVVPSSFPIILSSSGIFLEKDVLRYMVYNWAYSIAYQHTGIGSQEERLKRIINESSYKKTA
jgi:hypothetical protein